MKSQLRQKDNCISLSQSISQSINLPIGKQKKIFFNQFFSPCFIFPWSQSSDISRLVSLTRSY